MLEKMLQCMHDVNNKLACILGTATILKRFKCGDCIHSNLFSSIIESTLDASDIVRQCREEVTGQQAEAMSKICLYDHLVKFQDEMVRLASELSLSITVINKMSAGCSVMVYSTFTASAKKILNNLLFNAKKANATSLRFIAVEHESYVALHLVDDGDGMSPETLMCLGLSIASKTSTGQGTRIVKKMILQEGGMIEWSSPGIGAGCCVTIRMTKHKESI